MDNTACEEILDDFLNSFCNNITHATNNICPIAVLSQTTKTRSSTMTVSPATLATTVRALQPTCTCTASAMSVESSSQSSTSSLESSGKCPQTTCMNSAMALGVLLALAVVLLAVVTTGWVCICLIMKKRQDPAQNKLVHIQLCFAYIYM